jgi:hypothetical protein
VMCCLVPSAQGLRAMLAALLVKPLMSWTQPLVTRAPKLRTAWEQLLCCLHLPITTPSANHKHSANHTPPPTGVHPDVPVPRPVPRAARRHAAGVPRRQHHQQPLPPCSVTPHNSGLLGGRFSVLCICQSQPICQSHPALNRYSSRFTTQSCVTAHY